MTKLLRKKITGFTVIEMIVVIAISIVLTSVLILYSGDSRKFIEFSNQKFLILNAINRAKSYSLETYQPTQFTISQIGPSEVICGWGIHFEKKPTGDEYTIYKDIDSSSGDCSGPNVGVFDGGAETFEKNVVDAGVSSITCLDLVQSGFACTNLNSKNSFDIFFEPPEPIVIFNPEDTNLKDGVIKLGFIHGGCSIFRITRSAQIDLSEFSSSC